LRFLRWLCALLVIFTSGLLSSRLDETSAHHGSPNQALGQELATGRPSTHSRGIAIRFGRDVTERTGPERGAGTVKQAALHDGDGPPPKGTPHYPAHWTAWFHGEWNPDLCPGYPNSGEDSGAYGALEPEQGGHRGPPAGWCL